MVWAVADAVRRVDRAVDRRVVDLRVVPVVEAGHPFTLPSYQNRFLGVVDGMASLLPLAVVLVVIFGRQNLLNTPQRWEAAILLLLCCLADLVGGFAITIGLSRRTIGFGAPPA